MRDAIIPPEPATPAAGKNSSENGAQLTKAADPKAASIKALEGKTTIDDKMVVEAQILAYSAVSLIAEQVSKDFAQAFPPGKGKTVANAQTNATAVANQTSSAASGHVATTGVSGQTVPGADVVKAISTEVPDRCGQTTKAVVGPDQCQTCRYCVIVLDETLVSALGAYKVLMAELNLASASFKALITSEAKELKSEAKELKEPQGAPPPGVRALVLPAAIAGISAASDLGRSAIDLLSLFRQDTSYSGRAFVINNNALVLEVLRALRAKRPDITCLYPKLMPQGMMVSTIDGDHALQTRLHRVFDLRDRAHEELSNTQKKYLQLKMNISSGEVDVEALANKRAELESTQAAYAKATSRLEKVISGLQNAGDDGITQLEKVQKAEEILGRFGSRPGIAAPVKPLFLHVEAISIAGGYRVRSNLWKTLFNSDGLSYSGGAIVTYAFINLDAEIELCGTHRYRTPFVRFSDREEQIEINSF